MIVPQFWAEGRAQQRQGQRSFTVRRFGWSDQGQEAAQAHADARAQEAPQRLLAGQTLPRRELKCPYPGGGVPVREGIVMRDGDTIITRNAYGARCLNTPDVLFADIDFSSAPSLPLLLWIYALLLLAVLAAASLAEWRWLWIVLTILAGLFGGTIARVVHPRALALRGGAEIAARRRIERFLRAHPDWNLRLYRTPAGMRVLATHRLFRADEPEVTACFRALGADPIYARMCTSQNCFRARVSAKPWRIGIAQHLRPRPGVWPVRPEALPQRQVWIERYEQAASGFAACGFLAALGSGAVHPQARRVQGLHDELCRASLPLPLA